MQKRIGMPRRDRTLARLCVTAFAVCAALFVAVQVWCAVRFFSWGQAYFVAESFIALATAIGGATTVALARANTRGRVTPAAVLACVAGLCIALTAWMVFLAHDSYWVAFEFADDFVSAMRLLQAKEIAAPVVPISLIALLAARGWWVARWTARDFARRLGRALERAPTA